MNKKPDGQNELKDDSSGLYVDAESRNPDAILDYISGYANNQKQAMREIGMEDQDE